MGLPVVRSLVIVVCLLPRREMRIGSVPGAAPAHGPPHDPCWPYYSHFPANYKRPFSQSWSPFLPVNWVILPLFFSLTFRFSMDKMKKRALLPRLFRHCAKYSALRAKKRGPAALAKPRFVGPNCPKRAVTSRPAPFACGAPPAGRRKSPAAGGPAPWAAGTRTCSRNGGCHFRPAPPPGGSGS